MSDTHTQALKATLSLAEALIACPSVTPEDSGCQTLLAKRLAALGFACETLVFNADAKPAQQVNNLWAVRTAPAMADGAPAPLLVFAGHTDVVPPGPLDAWHTPPFTSGYRDGKLYGRGAADMKTSIAAMVVAVEQFLQHQPQAPLSLGFLLTSDEEGPAQYGTKAVVEALRARDVTIDYCVVGEPTASMRTGDVIKNGRRGSLSGRLTILGKQGHIAYPQLADNPIHRLAPALAALVNQTWDHGNADFPPTSFQISNIHAGTGANNVIPGELVLECNFRFSPESQPETLQNRLVRILEQHNLEYRIDWHLSGMPFACAPGTLLAAIEAAVERATGQRPEHCTSGGTSDGRFIATLCPQVVELGPPNATIHQVDECVALEDVKALTDCYLVLMQELSTTQCNDHAPIGRNTLDDQDENQSG